MNQDTDESTHDDAGYGTVDQAAMSEGQDLARTVALNGADEVEQVGDFVKAENLGEGVTDFRFACRIRGYEGWQWAVTLFRDEARGEWTVNDSVLVATDESLVAPQWVPWKDRIIADDLSVTDSIGTDPQDPRMDDGFVADRAVSAGGEQQSVAVAEESKDADRSAYEAGSAEFADSSSKQAGATDSSAKAAGAEETTKRGAAGDNNNSAGSNSSESGVGGSHTAVADDDDANIEDVAEAVESLSLSRRHVMSPLGRSQTAKRWHQGQHGPKSLSTKTADGNLCSTCGFYVPLSGELGGMFGACANKWSPDDGRVVSMDHGCGEHSEIDQPEPSHLWVQTAPAYDDVHIDVVEKKRKNHHAQVELLERIAEDAALH